MLQKLLSVLSLILISNVLAMDKDQGQILFANVYKKAKVQRKEIKERAITFAKNSKNFHEILFVKLPEMCPEILDDSTVNEDSSVIDIDEKIQSLDTTKKIYQVYNLLNKNWLSLEKDILGINIKYAYLLDKLGNMTPNEQDQVRKHLPQPWNLNHPKDFEVFLRNKVNALSELQKQCYTRKTDNDILQQCILSIGSNTDEAKLYQEFIKERFKIIKQSRPIISLQVEESANSQKGTCSIL